MRASGIDLERSCTPCLANALSPEAAHGFVAARLPAPLHVLAALLRSKGLAGATNGSGCRPRSERVRLYARSRRNGVNLNTLRTHPDLVGDVEPLTWGLQEVR